MARYHLTTTFSGSAAGAVIPSLTLEQEATVVREAHVTVAAGETGVLILNPEALDADGAAQSHRVHLESDVYGVLCWPVDSASPTAEPVTEVALWELRPTKGFQAIGLWSEGSIVAMGVSNPTDRDATVRAVYAHIAGDGDGDGTEEEGGGT